MARAKATRWVHHLYLEALGAAYAMALCHALHEGQPKESILEHLQRFNTSARLSLKANEEMMK